MSDAAAAIVAGDWRQAAKLITRIEHGNADTDTLRTLFRAGGRSQLIGITGAPGSGKSTLVNQLISALREAGKRIAVLAIDPSSPFSGGAILGDRVRMQRHSTDEHVFIRSMSSRGALGGLAKATGDALVVLDAMGWDTVLVETVGIGQNEIDIVRYAPTVVLIETPTTGDTVQSVKSGVSEIGDIFVVNKADLPGAGRRVNAIQEMLHNAAEQSGWQPTVLETDALNGHGIADLVTALATRDEFLKSHPQALRPRVIQAVKHQLLWIMHARMARTLASGAFSGVTQQQLDDLVDRRADPYELAARLTPE